MRILPIRLLLAYPLRTNLRGLPDPTTHTAARRVAVPTSAYARSLPSPHEPSSLCRQITVKLLRFLALVQSPLSQFPGLGIYKSNLLKARVIIASY